MTAKLTAKQEMFCREYLIDLNATQAAIRAGYSKDTANVIGCENLTKPNIQEYIHILVEERKKRVEITADDVLADVLETRKQAAELDRLAERLKANELLGKHLKMWTDKVDHQTLDKDGKPADNVSKIVIEHVSAKK
jgi:phage terminase small subunit